MDDRQKISVVLSSAELDRFNSYCDQKGYKKSTLIRRLIRDHLDHEGYPAPAGPGKRADLRQPTEAAAKRHAGRARTRGS